MHEILFFVDSKSLLTKSFQAEPRAVLQTALGHASAYLNCHCCQSGVMSRNFEDICIVYTLHLECAKLINLQDLFEAFVVIATGRDKKISQKELQ
jgi:origin recognition complex subunit 3